MPQNRRALPPASCTSSNSLRSPVVALRLFRQFPKNSMQRAQRKAENHREASLSCFVRQRLNSGQLSARQEFERRATTGGNVRNLVGKPGGVDRGDRVSATDD